MQFAQVVKNRHSVRGYLPKTVPQQTLREVLEVAQQAPSNCNTQPWQVYIASGNARDRLSKALVQEAMHKQPEPDLKMDISFDGIYRQRQVACAFELYNNMGIDRGDKQGRQQAMLRNWQFFDAPHVAFLAMDKSLGLNSIMDVGIYFQTLMLAMTDAGIACCPQLALAWFPNPIREAFAIPEQYAVIGGLSFGYEDPSVAANNTRLDRVSIDEAVTFIE